MDWANERYVRVYTRDTEDDLLLPWEAAALWHALIRKVDRAGVLEAKRGARSLALVTRIPLDVVERALPELLRDGRLAVHALGFVAPNFIEAQETPQSDRQRSAESRARRRDRGRLAQSQAATHGHAATRADTNRDGAVTNRDVRVTPGHAATRGDTSGHSDLSSLSSPDQTLQEAPRAPARDPSTPDPAVAARREAVDALWDAHQAARQAVAGELGVEALDLHPHDGGRAELAARLREAETAGEALEVAAERCRRVLGRVAADCRRDRTLDWLDGQLWRRDRFDRAYAKAASPAPQRATRAGPRQSGLGALLDDIAADEAKEAAT